MHTHRGPIRAQTQIGYNGYREGVGVYSRGVAKALVPPLEKIWQKVKGLPLGKRIRERDRLLSASRIGKDINYQVAWEWVVEND